MITIDQKVEMYRMRLEGKSYQAIADRFGISRQYAYELPAPEAYPGADGGGEMGGMNYGR